MSGYVTAAYLSTAVGLGLYAAYLSGRLRDLQRRSRPLSTDVPPTPSRDPGLSMSRADDTKLRPDDDDRGVGA